MSDSANLSFARDIRPLFTDLDVQPHEARWHGI